MNPCQPLVDTQYNISALDCGSSGLYRGLGSAGVVWWLLRTMLEGTSWSTSQTAREQSSFFPHLTVFHQESPHKHCWNPSCHAFLTQPNPLSWHKKSLAEGHAILKKKNSLKHKKRKTKMKALSGHLFWCGSQQQGPRGASAAAWPQTAGGVGAVPALTIWASCREMLGRSPN